MATKRLTERVAAPFAGSRVDRAAGTITGVLICGTESANGRDYPASVFRRDHAVYEGRPVNCDHGREPAVDRRFGWFSNVTCGEDGKPRGTLHCLKSHPMFERVMEAAERNPSLFGFSHIAHCTTRTEKGREVVESIRAVESIDLVAEPATTKGFFESTHMKISLKTFVERFGPKWGPQKWGAAKKLCEDMGAPADMPVMDAPPDDAPDGGDMKSALMSALAPMLDEAFESGDATKAVSALKDFIKLHAKHTGKGDGGDSSDDSNDSDDDPPSKKEAKVKPDPWTVLAEAKKVCGPDYNPGPAELEALAGLPTEAARLAYLTEQRVKLAEAKKESPKSGRTNSGTGGGTNTEAKLPKSLKELRESYGATAANN